MYSFFTTIFQKSISIKNESKVMKPGIAGEGGIEPTKMMLKALESKLGAFLLEEFAQSH